MKLKQTDIGFNSFENWFLHTLLQHYACLCDESDITFDGSGVFINQMQSVDCDANDIDLAGDSEAYRCLHAFHLLGLATIRCSAEQTSDNILKHTATAAAL